MSKRKGGGADVLAEKFPALVEGVTRDELELAAGYLRPATYRAGDALITQGRPTASLHLIVKGRVEVSIATETRSRTLADLGEGAWVGELGLIDPGLATATVQAKTPVEAWSLSQEGYWGLRTFAAEAASRIEGALVHELARRLRSTKPTDGAPSDLPRESAVRDSPWSLNFGRLSHFPGLDQLDRRTLEAIEMACHSRRFAPGDVIIRQGTKQDHRLLFVLAGVVKIVVSAGKQKFVGPGTILGTVAFLDAGMRSVSCVAESVVEATELSAFWGRSLFHSPGPAWQALKTAIAKQVVRDVRELDAMLLRDGSPD